MTHVVNSQDCPLATDKECTDRRNSLIAAGIITPGNRASIVVKKSSPPVVSTRENAKNLRETLIERGFISPVSQRRDGSVSYCDLPPHQHNPSNNEEGEYKVQPIKSDNEYYRRRQIYFRSIQEILHSRRELKLILGKKKDSDPDWYF